MGILVAYASNDNPGGIMAMDMLATDVTSAGGFMKISMRDIRKAHGTSKLGSGVVREIHEGLAAVGLGHCGHPGPDLPTSQRAMVWLYAQGSAVADLIKDVQAPGHAESVISMIRELVA